MVLDDKNFLCSGGKFFGREDSTFSKNGQNKCPFFDSPKKSWEKKEKIRLYMCRTTFLTLFLKSPDFPYIM
jgi:hypothetical protein